MGAVMLLRASATAIPLADESVDAVVCDPPYDLTAGKKGGSGAASVNLDSPYGRARISTGNGAGGFMGKAWDSTGVAFDPVTWREALRVLKPGGHLLAFGGTRTYHRMTCAIEDAGFEIRDCLMWLYGSGFPKSLDVSKAIDRQRYVDGVSRERLIDVTTPATGEAAQWEGWGTALKPAWEPIVMARKPLAGTVAQNVLAHGTGALNIDGTRIGADWLAERGATWLRSGSQAAADSEWQGPSVKKLGSTVADRVSDLGRWPANVVLDEVSAALLGDSGGPSRFFYTSKSSRSEREAGLEAFEPQRRTDGRETDIENPRLRTSARRNDHPTVKPVDLMRWLVRLVTPPNGLVLDPFVGSGTTGMAARREGFRFVGIDLDPHYLEIARRRIAAYADQLQAAVIAAAEEREHQTVMEL